MLVTLRFFAAARAAAGVGEVVVTAAERSTIADVLSAFGADRADAADLGAVVARCTFLLNAVAASEDAALQNGDSIDVLPPFAGG